MPGQGIARSLSVLLRYLSQIKNIRIILAAAQLTCTAYLRRSGVSACSRPASLPVHGGHTLHLQGRARAAPTKGTWQACFHHAWLGSVPLIRGARAAEARRFLRRGTTAGSSMPLLAEAGTVAARGFAEASSPPLMKMQLQSGPPKTTNGQRQVRTALYAKGYVVDGRRLPPRALQGTRRSIAPRLPRLRHRI